MCRNSVKASDKTGKATLKGCIADARALEKCTIPHKIGRRIELQNPNGRENQAEMKKVISDIRYQISDIMPKIGKKE